MIAKTRRRRRRNERDRSTKGKDGSLEVTGRDDMEGKVKKNREGGREEREEGRERGKERKK